MDNTELTAAPPTGGAENWRATTTSPPDRRRALADAVRTYAAALFRYCWGRLRDRQLAEDAVQETFLRAFSAAGRGPLANLGGWLFGAARRCCQEIGRRRRRPAERAVRLDSVPDPPAPPDGDDLDGLLAGLGDEERCLVYLKHVSGLKCREIAAATGVPVGTVTSALARAYTKLRASFREQG